MANLTETSQWEAGIYQIETSDPVLGGPDGVSNKPLKHLANRTLYLYENKVDNTVTLTAGNGLSGGGALSQNREISLGTPSTITEQSKNSVSETSHTHAISSASTKAKGIVKLNVSTSSTSVTEAATPSAVKDTYDLAAAALDRAGRNIQVVTATPTTKDSGDVIYSTQRRCIQFWQTFGSWSGYASADIGMPILDASARPNCISAMGAVVKKASYPALWAWAQASGLVKNVATAVVGTYYFIDINNTDFRLPDLRNQFFRANGTYLETNATRYVGTAQDFALPNFAMNLAIWTGEPLRRATAATPITGVLATAGDGGVVHSDKPPTGGVFPETARAGRTSTPNGVPLGAEVRPKNTAFFPRIIAF